MLGLARKLFTERHATLLGQEEKAAFPPAQWPLLQRLSESGSLDYIDVFFAHTLMQKVDLVDEATAAYLSYLCMAARQGHICVQIENQALTPTLEELCLQREETMASILQSTAGWQSFHDLVLGGASSNSVLVAQAEANLAFPTPIVRRGNFHYLQKYWMLESLLLKPLLRFLSDDEVASMPIDMLKAEQEVSSLLAQRQLLPEQAMAITLGCKHRLSIVTGGPGTGKTYTAGLLLRTLWGCFVGDKHSLKIALAAPTGKAAANLQASIQRAMSDIASFPPLPAQTLHHLLGLSKTNKNIKGSILEADIIMIDECSMIDANLMESLLSRVKPTAKIILLGDPDQLSPIDMGAVFADMVAYLQCLPAEHRQQRLTALKICVRSELQDIIELAQAIKTGETGSMVQLLQTPKEGLKYVELDKEKQGKEWKKHLLQYTITRFPTINQEPQNPQQLLKDFNAFRLLTPLRQGPFGVDALNAVLLEYALKSKRGSCLAIPIMITTNDYHSALFNGEMGVLIKYDDAALNYAYFPGKGTEEIRRISALLLPAYEYAYCVSVHKSQGSEFGHVLILLPEGSEVFGREAFYTAVTRAKKSLEIWSAPNMLSQIVAKSTKRLSGLTPRLSSLLQN